MPILTIALAVVAAAAVVLFVFRGPRIDSSDGGTLTHEARMRRGLHAAAIIAPLAILVALQALFIRF